MEIEFETKNLARNESFIVFINWFPQLIITPSMEPGDTRTPASKHSLTLNSEGLSLSKNGTAEFDLPPG